MLDYKRLFIQASIALLLSLMLSSSLSGAGAAQMTRICPQGCSNLSIQEALVNASAGDTIIVESGIYANPFIMGRPVNLQGRDTGSGNPILNPEKGRAILAAQGAMLSGFDFSSARAGDERSAGCRLEVVLPATIYLNDFPGKNSVCPEDVATWNSSRMISYQYNSRVQRSFLGNYWADYAGEDKNGDGIGDEPVVLNQDNIDNYPLMQPAESYLISDEADALGKSEMELLDARVGEEFIISLSANPTTGYGWNVDYDHSLLNLKSSDFRASSSKALGASGTSIFVFEPLMPGKTTIYFVYKRSWENIVADARAFQVEISA
ncbi:MAG: protease inhibitor I42 family protein [Methanothrix soehngenii]|jgi:predicted secreted protein/nitrous oxidase accessory protein NosD|uniref:protease inhibitor I42 family protein n=1 Tax=Methanothrix soehngenii TaxID=2223 RepID=UPI0031418354